MFGGKISREYLNPPKLYINRLILGNQSGKKPTKILDFENKSTMTQIEEVDLLFPTPR